MVIGAENSQKCSDTLLGASCFAVDVRYFMPDNSPPQSLEDIQSEQLTYILMHEMTHIRRFDMLRKIAAAAVLCIHWFNPIVWVLFLLYNRDIELACDETVVRKIKGDCRSAYALALIGMEERQRGSSSLCSHFSKNAIEERIVAIMKFKKISIAAAVLASSLVLGVTSAFATSAVSVSEKSDKRDIVIDKTDAAYLRQGGYDVPDVEWWTYDEYKAWLDKERVELQEMLGERVGQAAGATLYGHRKLSMKP